MDGFVPCLLPHLTCNEHFYGEKAAYKCYFASSFCLSWDRTQNFAHARLAPIVELYPCPKYHLTRLYNVPALLLP